MNKKTIKIPQEIAYKLFGKLDENVTLIGTKLSCAIRVCPDGLELDGKDCAKTEVLIKQLTRLIGKGIEIDKQVVATSLDLVISDNADGIMQIYENIIATTAKGKKIYAKTLGQLSYTNAIQKHTITFGVGPAGTGKTYLAVALATAALKKGDIEKIILTRPAIEAGEKLGFLPGDLNQKVDPYLRPLFDALLEFLGENYLKLVERQIIEIAPLAYMRGRTLSKAFIILDEAQNTTPEQMKMFLTRLGETSKMIINGDVTQIDLPFGKQSGLIEAVKILNNIPEISINTLTAKDIVRHELVQKIVNAYEQYSNK